MIKYHEMFFDIALYISYMLYLVAFFQIEHYNPDYLSTLENIIKYYVIGFLLLRFNPFTRHSFTEFDRKVVFSSAIFLLTTTAINQYAVDLDGAEFLKRTFTFIK